MMYYVARATLFAFHFTVILLSRVNDKDKQQVCGCIKGSLSVGT